MATLPNATIDAVPAESPDQADPFPALDPINTFDLVGPTAANRQPDALKQRDFTLRDRVNLLIDNMNHISTGEGSAVLFLPRDGTNPMTADLDMGGKKFVNYGVVLPAPSSTPDDYVQVSAGTYQKTDGKGYVTFAGGSVQITTPVGGGQTRYDLVHIDDSGTLGVTQGVAGTPGTVPDFPDDELMIAIIKVDETGTIVVNAADITDVRPFLAADQNARALQTRPVDDSAPSVADALVWDGAKWSPAAGQGLKLGVEVSSESALSAVTVGEAGCDYNTIAAAITYIGALTRSESRQCAILLFEKRDGQDWTVSSAITIPTWTHFVGVGKPTLKTTVTSGDVITLNEGSSIENMCIENSATGWAYQIASAADDVTIRNVDIRHEHASVNSGYAVGIKSGSRIKIEGFRLFPNAATATNGCRGIKFGDSGNVNDAMIANCYLEGDQDLFTQASNGILQSQVSNLRMLASSTTASYAFGNMTNVRYCTFVNVVGTCAAGATAGWRIGGGYGSCLANIRLEVASSDDMLLFELSSTAGQAVEVCGCTARFGRMKLTRGRIVGGRVHYDYNDANPALELDGECTVSACRISRGTQNAPGIEAGAATADDCVISGCQVLDTGTSASIKGVTGADNWYVSNCVVDVATDPNSGSGWIYGGTFTNHEKVV